MDAIAALIQERSGYVRKKPLRYGNVYTKAGFEFVLGIELVKAPGILGFSPGHHSLLGSDKIPAQHELPLALPRTVEVSLQEQLCFHPTDKLQSCPKVNSCCCHSLREQSNPWQNPWQPFPALAHAGAATASQEKQHRGVCSCLSGPG